METVVFVVVNYVVTSYDRYNITTHDPIKTTRSIS